MTWEQFDQDLANIIGSTDDIRERWILLDEIIESLSDPGEHDLVHERLRRSIDRWRAQLGLPPVDWTPIPPAAAVSPMESP